MKTKFLLISISVISFCLNFNLKGQDIDLAKTFSQREISGTARMQGMGGVSSSLGGDISSTIGNPAGLGFFNRSEFSFSPSIGIHNSDANFRGESTSDYKTNFNFGTVGIVINNSKVNPQGAWRGGSFGISYTRINDFHNQVNYKGRSTSIEDGDFVGSALQGAYYEGNEIRFVDDFSELAFETFLIDEFYNEENDEFFLDTYNDRDIETGFPVSQSEIITTNGAGYSTNFSYGGNFADKFYIGASLAFSSINYEINRTYRESPSDTDLNDLVLNEIRNIEGSGFNLSLGAIYRPVTSLSFGISYTSPTFYSLEDVSSIGLVANYFDGSEDFRIDYAPFQYEYRTPSRLNGGISYFIGENGFISADVEYVDYAGNEYSSNQVDFSFENGEIDAALTSAVNYKIGGEYRLNIFRFRGGYAFFDDPVNFGDRIDRSRHSFALGAGIKLPKYYLDLAVVNTRFESSYIPYVNTDVDIDTPMAAVDNNSTRAMLTLGFNF